MKDYAITRFLGYDPYSDSKDLKPGWFSSLNNALIKGGKLTKMPGLLVFFDSIAMFEGASIYLFKDATGRAKLLCFVRNHLFSIGYPSMELTQNLWVDSTHGVNMAYNVQLDCLNFVDMCLIANGVVPLKKLTMDASAVTAVSGTPPTIEFLELHKNRVFGAIDTSLWYSPINNPEGTYSEVKVDQKNNAKIVAIKEIGNYLYIFKENKIYYLDTYADAPSGWKVVPVPQEISGVLKGGVYKIPDYFTVVATNKGIYAFDGTGLAPISEQINDQLSAIPYKAKRAAFWFDKSSKSVGVNFVPDNPINNPSFTSALGAGASLFEHHEITTSGSGAVTQATDGDRKYARLAVTGVGDLAAIKTKPFPVTANRLYRLNFALKHYSGTASLTRKLYGSTSYDDSGGVLLYEQTLVYGSGPFWSVNAFVPDDYALGNYNWLRYEFELTSAGAAVMGIDDLYALEQVQETGFVYSLIDKLWQPSSIEINSSALLPDEKTVVATLNRNDDVYSGAATVLAVPMSGTTILGRNINTSATIGPTDLKYKGNKLFSYIDLTAKQIGDYDIAVRVTNEKGTAITKTINLAGSDDNHEYRVLIVLPGKFFTIEIIDNSTNPAFEISELTAYFKAGAGR